MNKIKKVFLALMCLGIVCMFAGCRAVEASGDTKISIDSSGKGTQVEELELSKNYFKSEYSKFNDPEAFVKYLNSKINSDLGVTVKLSSTARNGYYRFELSMNFDSVKKYNDKLVKIANELKKLNSDKKIINMPDMYGEVHYPTVVDKAVQSILKKYNFTYDVNSDSYKTLLKCVANQEGEDGPDCKVLDSIVEEEYTTLGYESDVLDEYVTEKAKNVSIKKAAACLLSDYVYKLVCVNLDEVVNIDAINKEGADRVSNYFVNEVTRSLDNKKFQDKVKTMTQKDISKLSKDELMNFFPYGDVEGLFFMDLMDMSDAYFTMPLSEFFDAEEGDTYGNVYIANKKVDSKNNCSNGGSYNATLGDNSGVGIDNDNKNVSIDDTPKTGDNFLYMLYVTIALISVVAVVVSGVMIIKKRRR